MQQACHTHERIEAKKSFDKIELVPESVQDKASQ
jgi:hypothetical protein